MDENITKRTAEELELTDAQADRNDEIYEAAFEFCKVLTEPPNLDWDMAFLGEIADLAAGIRTVGIGKFLRKHCKTDTAS